MSKIEVQGIKIDGRSVSGFETVIALPEYNLCFDIGMVTHEAKQAEHVAITHGHFDHFGAVTKHAYLRGMLSMSPSQYIVPPWLVDHLHNDFAHWARVQEARKAPYGVTKLMPTGRVKIAKGRFLHAFATNHRIRSQGYVLVDERSKLKPEFVGTPGQELGRLRKEGVVFTDTIQVPLVAFTGDTRADVFDGIPSLVMRSKVLMVECTFLDDVTEKEALEKGHVHIDQLARRAKQFKDVGRVVLVHFSKRYTNKEIERAIRDRLPKELREKTVHLPVGK